MEDIPGIWERAADPASNANSAGANAVATVVVLPERSLPPHRRPFMKRFSIAIATPLLLAVGGWAWAHPMMGEITWNRQISRIVYSHCVSCHRDGGASFPLVEYAQARGAAEAIKRAVLSRSMPPWGAVKGFGALRDEQGLSEAQVEMIVEWVDTGTGRGNNPRALPEQPPRPAAIAPFVAPKDSIAVTGAFRLERAARIAGVFPQDVSPETSAQIVAVLPGGEIAPLVWLYGYREQFAHPFWLENTLNLPAGTVIRGVPEDTTVLLIPRRR